MVCLITAWCLLSTPVLSLAQTKPNNTPETEETSPKPNPDDWEGTLRMGTNAYVSADYESVITLLSPWANADKLTNIPTRRRLRLLEILSLAYILQNPPRSQEARQVMGLLLTEDPKFTFDEGLATAAALRLLEDVKDNMGIEPDPIDTGVDTQTIYIQRDEVRNQFWLVFFPFGIGQFQNEDTIKGLFLLLTQVGALGANVTSFFLVENLRNERGLYNPKDAETANTLQVVQFTAWWIFIGLVTFGIADAWYAYEESTVDIRTLDEAPIELRGNGLPPEATAPAPTWNGPPPSMFHLGLPF